MTAVRTRLEAAAKAGRGSHAGLIFSRYLLQQESPDDRAQLLEHTRKAARNAQAIYKLAFDRWQADTMGHVSGVYRVRSRLITGLGAKGVLETGIRLHHTYGTPLIPGSGLKGMAAHHLRSAYQDAAEFSVAAVHKTLFGSTASGGHITFQDAWILPESLESEREGLVPDVITSHHPKYYSGEAIPPHDSEDPNPVTFLSVRGRFRVVVDCDGAGEKGMEWGRFALRLLEEAFERSGAGGKTSSGYGRLSRVK